MDFSTILKLKHVFIKTLHLSLQNPSGQRIQLFLNSFRVLIQENVEKCFFKLFWGLPCGSFLHKTAFFLNNPMGQHIVFVVESLQRPDPRKLLEIRQLHENV